MDLFETIPIGKILNGNSYVGRGIAVGKSADGKNAAVAYFIMGRSENSRNRKFVENGDDLIIYPYDEKKVTDPSLIIYSPIRKTQNKLIVTNGDQTDTICNFIETGRSFTQALRTRGFEPDAPNFTPRISCMLTFEKEKFDYEMSILKSADKDGTLCSRFNFSYPAIDGVGHFIHTYIGDANPLPSFADEPERIINPSSIDDFTNDIWENLNEDNKISLYTRYINLENGEVQNRLINKYN